MLLRFVNPNLNKDYFDFDFDFVEHYIIQKINSRGCHWLIAMGHQATRVIPLANSPELWLSPTINTIQQMAIANNSLSGALPHFDYIQNTFVISLHGPTIAQVQKEHPSELVLEVLRFSRSLIKWNLCCIVSHWVVLNTYSCNAHVMIHECLSICPSWHVLISYRGAFLNFWIHFILKWQMICYLVCLIG